MALAHLYFLMKPKVLWAQLRTGHSVRVSSDERMNEWRQCESRIEGVVRERGPQLPNLLVANPSRIRWLGDKRDRADVEVGNFLLERLEDYLPPHGLGMDALCRYSHRIDTYSPSMLTYYLIRYTQRHNTLRKLSELPDWYTGRWSPSPHDLTLKLGHH